MMKRSNSSSSLASNAQFSPLPKEPEPDDNERGESREGQESGTTPSQAYTSAASTPPSPGLSKCGTPTPGGSTFRFACIETFDATRRHGLAQSERSPQKKGLCSPTLPRRCQQVRIAWVLFSGWVLLVTVIYVGLRLQRPHASSEVVMQSQLRLPSPRSPPMPPSQPPSQPHLPSPPPSLPPLSPPLHSCVEFANRVDFSILDPPKRLGR